MSPRSAKQKCPTWALRGVKPDRAETSVTAALAGFAGLPFGAFSFVVGFHQRGPSRGLPAGRFVARALFASAAFLRRGFVLFGLDVLQNGAEMFVLDDRRMRDALIHVEDLVGQGAPF